MTTINYDSIIAFCIDRLSIRKDLDVIVTECCLKHDNAMGWTYDVHENEIDIEIDVNLDKSDKLLTLCHEMVHVLQYSEGRDANEHEAYKLENKLYKEYKRYVR